jgi:large subunit ribosomal protein L25
VYGGKKDVQVISVDHNELWNSLKSESFYSKILTLNLNGQSEQVVLKDLQRHPVKDEVIHLDLQRVLADVALRMRIPVHFKGGEVAPGVKIGGGVVEHHVNEIEVECLPKDLPEFFEIDLSKLELNEAVHLSQIPLPAGVELIELKHGNDRSVAAVHLPRAVEEVEVAPTEAATAEVPATAQKAPDAKDAAAAGDKKPEAKKDEKKK